jgi:general secretion pathway protein I
VPRVPRTTRRRHGMTLIEVLVSTVLLGVGVAGLLSVASLSLRNQQRVDQRTAALLLAQEKLAEIDMRGAAVWTQSEPMQGRQQQGQVLYTWQIEIDDLTAGELHSVLVTVNWSAPTSDGSVQLETWLNDYAAVEAEEEPLEQPTPPGGPR